MDKTPILQAPFRSLFDRNFYAAMTRENVGRGMLYLVYLAAIATLIGWLFFSNRGIPELTRFIDWAKQEVPPLTWTPEGLVMNAQSPYVMFHEEMGNVVTFDMTKFEVGLQDLADSLVFVTSTKIFVRQGTGDVRVYDLLQPEITRPPGELVLNIDADTIQKFYDALKPWLHVFFILIFFPAFFVWKVLEGLLYSLIGLLINTRRREKLPYGAILNVTFFALTPLTIVQGLGFMALPFLDQQPVSSLLALVLISTYLFLAIRKTEVEMPDSI
ncbi:MAG: DUF1189 family protein [Candidatus Omnitrophota bacterium]|nr:DUF1189 family protein [Candidatus Omnitrophota bacterium]